MWSSYKCTTSVVCIESQSLIGGVRVIYCVLFVRVYALYANEEDRKTTTRWRGFWDYAIFVFKLEIAADWKGAVSKTDRGNPDYVGSHHIVGKRNRVNHKLTCITFMYAIEDIWRGCLDVVKSVCIAVGFRGNLCPSFDNSIPCIEVFQGTWVRIETS